MPDPKYKVGEKIEIIGNTIGFINEGKIGPFYGTIKGINGKEIYIKPRYQRWIGHWYMWEIKKIEYVEESKIRGNNTDA
jgi:hypothetical protein